MKFAPRLRTCDTVGWNGSRSAPKLLILGTRGVPAAHGGFETFAERLALHLVALGWDVAVYCQKEVEVVRQRVAEDEWRGIRRITVEVARSGPLATLEFDWHATLDARRRDGVCLVLGYNSAAFLPLLRLAGRRIVTNMDGLEWKRPKWSAPVRAWFFLNEWVAAWTSHRLIADHPAIGDHLATRRSRSAITVIPYGGDPIWEAPVAPVHELGLEPDKYFLSIARIEPDNGTLLLVEAFCSRPRAHRLVVLGTLRDDIPYHQAVRAAAEGHDVLFPGAIYDQKRVGALRRHARAYVHGHTVGGTNPSLVEALAAGNAVIAHQNRFNLWTAGPGQFFYEDRDTLSRLFDRVMTDDGAVAAARVAARLRAEQEFTWSSILEAYRDELAPQGMITLADAPSSPARPPRSPQPVSASLP